MTSLALRISSTALEAAACGIVMGAFIILIRKIQLSLGSGTRAKQEESASIVISL